MQGAPQLAHAEAAPANAGWTAALDVTIGARAGRSVVARRAHHGPLAVQRAFYPEGPARPHVYVLHPPGGLVGADDLALRFGVEAGAQALFTTPAATKIYRTHPDVRASSQRSVFSVDDQAVCEWLPHETIVFAGARAVLTTKVELAETARFIGWELLCLGRPACGERFDRGACELRFELRRQGRPVLLERTRVRADGALATAPWGLGGRPVFGMAIASPAPAVELDEELRAVVDEAPPSDLASVTRVDGALVARYVGGDAEPARTFFCRLWTAMRPDVIGAPAVPPRIWAT